MSVANTGLEVASSQHINTRTFTDLTGDQNAPVTIFSKILSLDYVYQMSLDCRLEENGSTEIYSVEKQDVNTGFWMPMIQVETGATPRQIICVLDPLNDNALEYRVTLETDSVSVRAYPTTTYLTKLGKN